VSRPESDRCTTCLGPLRDETIGVVGAGAFPLIWFCGYRCLLRWVQARVAPLN
jgi:hypothetical protein